MFKLDSSRIAAVRAVPAKLQRVVGLAARPVKPAQPTRIAAARGQQGAGRRRQRLASVLRR